MKYLIIKSSLVDPRTYVQSSDQRLFLQELYELHNFSTIKISNELYGIYNKIWEGKFVEIDQDTAIYGSVLTSELRDVAKVWEAGSEGYAEKTKIEMTPEIKSKVVSFMKIYAKEIVEYEYEKRFLRYRNTNNLETTSWQIQKHEAKEWLKYQGEEGHETPFLDYLSIRKGKDKTALAHKILEKAESYEDGLSTLLVDMQIILDKFDDCTTIWDINILYEDYLGVLMPNNQAAELGRTSSEYDTVRLPQYEVKPNELGF